MLERVAGVLDDVCLTFLLEEYFDFDQTSFLTKNVRQTSSNTPATRSNIVRPTMLYNNVRTCSWGLILWGHYSVVLVF